MQYRVKHQFSDFVVQAVLDNGHAQVFVVSDDVSPTTAALELVVYRIVAPGGTQCACTSGACGAPGAKTFFDPIVAVPAGAAGAEPVWSKKIQVAVPALNAALVVNASAAELLAALPKCTPATCFLRATATAAATRTKAAATSSADLFFKHFKELKTAQPKLEIGGFTQEGKSRVSFDVSTNTNAALLVVLETDLKGKFTSNMFNLQPCGSMRMTFEAMPRGGAVTVEDLAATITASTLWENQLDDVTPHGDAPEAVEQLPFPVLEVNVAVGDAVREVIKSVVKTVEQAKEVKQPKAGKKDKGPEPAASKKAPADKAPAAEHKHREEAKPAARKAAEEKPVEAGKPAADAAKAPAEHKLQEEEKKKPLVAAPATEEKASEAQAQAGVKAAALDAEDGAEAGPEIVAAAVPEIDVEEETEVDVVEAAAAPEADEPEDEADAASEVENAS